MENMKCGDVRRLRVWRRSEKKFGDTIIECTNDVCGMRRVGGQRRN